MNFAQILIVAAIVAAPAARPDATICVATGFANGAIFALHSATTRKRECAWEEAWHNRDGRPLSRYCGDEYATWGIWEAEHRFGDPHTLPPNYFVRVPLEVLYMDMELTLIDSWVSQSHVAMGFMVGLSRAWDGVSDIFFYRRGEVCVVRDIYGVLSYVFNKFLTQLMH